MRIISSKDVNRILKNVTQLDSHRLKNKRTSTLTVAQEIIKNYKEDGERVSASSNYDNETVAVLDTKLKKPADSLNFGTY